MGRDPRSQQPPPEDFASPDDYDAVLNDRLGMSAGVPKQQRVKEMARYEAQACKMLSTKHPAAYTLQAEIKELTNSQQLPTFSWLAERLSLSFELQAYRKFTGKPRELFNRMENTSVFKFLCDANDLSLGTGGKTQCVVFDCPVLNRFTVLRPYGEGVGLDYNWIEGGARLLVNTAERGVVVVESLLSFALQELQGQD